MDTGHRARAGVLTLCQRNERHGRIVTAPEAPHARYTGPHLDCGGFFYARTAGERSTNMPDDPHCWDDMTELDDPEENTDVAD